MHHFYKQDQGYPTFIVDLFILTFQLDFQNLKRSNSMICNGNRSYSVGLLGFSSSSLALSNNMSYVRLSKLLFRFPTNWLKMLF